MVTHLLTVTHPNTNWARRWLSSLIKTNELAIIH